MVTQQRPVIHFRKGAHKFEVYQKQLDGRVGFLGFYDGRLSVASDDYHAVTRMLLRRHGPVRAQPHRAHKTDVRTSAGPKDDVRRPITRA